MASPRDEAPLEWTWVQPRGIADLRSRLAHARDFQVPERERENLCSVAHGQIGALVESLDALIGELYFVRLSEKDHRVECVLCHATKGARHASNCAVGKAEDVISGGK